MQENLSWTLDEKKYLRLDEVKELRASCRQVRNLALNLDKTIAVRDWFMIELGLNSGLRVEEMRNLKMEDLNIQRNQSSLVVKKGKGGKTRIVYINSRFKNTCKWFIRWKINLGQETKAEDYLLTKRNGKQLVKRALQKAFKRCIKIANLPEYYSIHALRHTYGTHLYIASNHNLRLVQEQLGHSSIKITEVYASLINADTRNAIERLYR
jgi:site-specific recombinase XerD